MIKNERTRDFLLDIIKYYIDLDLKDYTLIDNEKNSWRRSGDVKYYGRVKKTK